MAPRTRIRFPGRRNSGVTRFGRVAIVLAIAVGLVLGSPIAAAASETTGLLAAPADLQQVINNLRVWLVGLLVALATLFLTIGGVRYLSAGGDPGQVAKAKEAVRNAAIGYALAVLAPILVTALQSIVG